MERIDYEAIRRDHPLDRAVEKVTGGEVTTRKNIPCPLPGHDDSTPSFRVYDNGRFHCFGCGEHGDIIDFMMLMYGWDRLETLDKIGEIKVSPLPKRSQPSKPPVALNIDTKIAAQYHNQLQPQHYTEWTKQGIHSDALRHFKIGWTGSRYSFAWTYRGVVQAIKLRRSDTFSPELKPKYLSLKGSHYTAPFNIDAVILADEPPDTVLIVEDEKSVMMAWQFGYTAISIPANGFKPKWRLWLAMTKRVCFVPDNDKVGQEAAKGFRAIIPGAEMVWVPNVYTDKGEHVKDLFDYGSGFGNLDFLKT